MVQLTHGVGPTKHTCEQNSRRHNNVHALTFADGLLHDLSLCELASVFKLVETQPPLAAKTDSEAPARSTMPDKFRETPLDDIGNGTMSPKADVLGNQKRQVESNSFSILGDNELHQHGMDEELVGNHSALVVQRSEPGMKRSSHRWIG